MTFHFQYLGFWFLLKYMSFLTCNVLMKSSSLRNGVLSLSLHISDFQSPYSVRMQLGKAITVQAEIYQDQPFSCRPGTLLRESSWGHFGVFACV